MCSEFFGPDVMQIMKVLFVVAAFITVFAVLSFGLVFLTAVFHRREVQKRIEMLRRAGW